MDRRVETIIALIQKDIRHRPSLKQLAQLVHLSPSRLNHLFREETDASLVQYIKTIRLRRAKDLLETTFLNVKETMVSVGVNDPSHFVRDFKKLFGVTPSEFRKHKLLVLPAEVQTSLSKRGQRTTTSANR